MHWVRRSRSGFAWIDGVDAPVDGGTARYKVQWSAGALSGEIENGTSEIMLPGAEISALRSAGPVLTVVVAQIGDAGVSPPLQQALSLA